MWKLYEISQLLQDTVDACLAKAADAEGEITEDWSEFLDAVKLDRDQKALDIGRYIKNLSAEAEAVKAEKQVLAKRQATLENRVESLKAYLSNHLQAGEKISDANTVLSWRRSSSVEILYGARLPECYVRTEIIPDKTALKKALIAGEQIQGVSIIEKNNISIK
jgi:hypothetical protein